MSSTIIPPPRKKVESMVVPRSGVGEMARDFVGKLRAVLENRGYDIKAGPGRKAKDDSLMSLAKLADRAGVDPSWLSRLVNRKRPEVVDIVTRMARLARALNTTVEYLASEDDAPADSSKRQTGSPSDDADSSGIRPASKQSRK